MSSSNIKCISSVQSPVSHRKILNNLTKSPADKRDFRALEFDNGLKVILIHDKETDKAAGALCVAAGSMNDPVEFPGLAHFLEHMLFLGTEKYPEESGFDVFLNQNGGFSNAYTSLDCTVYYFGVSPEKLPLALDRFAQFFISPLFNESATEREVNAVNSENEKNIPNDNKRIIRIDQATSDPSHPYSKFTTGNRYSLWIKPLVENLDVRKTLIEFHHTFYSSNLMTLTVIGKESLDELQDIIESLFSGLLNKQLDKPVWPINPYGEDQLQLRIDIMPIKDLRILALAFPVPDTTIYYKTAPITYVSHLIGHEGVGSLLSLLKRKGWATELRSGSASPARGFNFFTVFISLTIDGLGNINTIVEHAFQYLKMLREEGIQEWIWEEIRDIQAFQFRFKDKPSPGSDVVQLVTKLQNFPLEDILTVGHILTDYKPELINEILNCLTPSNCRITTVSKENKSIANITEPWYKAQYSIQKIDPILIQKWSNSGNHDELKLPLKNEFVPTVFDLKSREDTGIIPKILVNNSLSRAWFLQDNEFLLPKGRIQLELYSPLPLLGPRQIALNCLMSKVIEDALTEIVYPASVAGLSQSVSNSLYGLEICIHGYDHKLKLLLNKVMDKIINFSVDAKRFIILKEVYSRQLKNWEDSEPRIHALWYVGHILTEKDWTHQAILETLEDVTAENLETYVRDFISTLRLQWLICGNFTSSDAQEIVHNVQNLFEQKGTKPLLPSQLIRLRSVQLCAGSDHVFERDHMSHSSSCTAVLFQGGVKNTRDNVIIELLGLIAEQPCFQQLRTQEQLGYAVQAGVKKIYGVLGIFVLVQSNFHPNYLESRIDNFLQVLKDKIFGLSEEEFTMFRMALVVRKSEKIKTLGARTSLVWHEIELEEYNFDRKKIELDELENISHKEVCKFFEDLIGPPSKEKGRLGVHIISQMSDGAGKKPDCFGPHPIDLSKRTIHPILNILEWKSKHDLHIHPKPFLEITSTV